jgi:hypothetical protein
MPTSPDIYPRAGFPPILGNPRARARKPTLERAPAETGSSPDRPNPRVKPAGSSSDARPLLTRLARAKILGRPTFTRIEIRTRIAKRTRTLCRAVCLKLRGYGSDLGGYFILFQRVGALDGGEAGGFTVPAV